jgi:hypothetical protein
VPAGKNSIIWPAGNSESWTVRTRPVVLYPPTFPEFCALSYFKIQRFQNLQEYTMLYLRKSVFGAMGLVTLLLASCVSCALSATECSTKESQCQASCAAIGAQADFHCDLQGGTWATSCACASPNGGVATTQTPASVNSSPLGASNPPPPPPLALQIPAPTPTTPATASCDQQRKECAQSCPSGTVATVDCKQSSAIGASAVANSCVCAPLSPSPTAVSPSPSTPPSVAGSTLGQADGGQVSAASGPNQAPASFALRPPGSLGWICVS